MITWVYEIFFFIQTITSDRLKQKIMFESKENSRTTELKGRKFFFPHYETQTKKKYYLVFLEFFS